jgi:hypothetical protein
VEVEVKAFTFIKDTCPPIAMVTPLPANAEVGNVTVLVLVLVGVVKPLLVEVMYAIMDRYERFVDYACKLQGYWIFVRPEMLMALKLKRFRQFE